MTLADHAQVADGKLFISGGGWSACGPGPAPCAVAVIFHVPWQETGERVSFTLRPVHEHGYGASSQERRTAPCSGQRPLRGPLLRPHHARHRDQRADGSFNIILPICPGAEKQPLTAGR